MERSLSRREGERGEPTSGTINAQGKGMHGEDSSMDSKIVDRNKEERATRDGAGRGLEIRLTRLAEATGSTAG